MAIGYNTDQFKIPFCFDLCISVCVIKIQVAEIIRCLWRLIQKFWLTQGQTLLNTTRIDDAFFLSNLHKLRPLDLFAPTLRRNGSDLDIVPIYMYGMIWSFNFHRPNILYPFFMNLGLSLFTYSTNRYRFIV